MYDGVRSCQVLEDFVFEAQPYMLFYARQDAFKDSTYFQLIETTLLQKIRGYTDIARDDERIREPAATEEAMQQLETDQHEADAAEVRELRAILLRLSQYKAEGTETFKFFEAEEEAKSSSKSESQSESQDDLVVDA